MRRIQATIETTYKSARPARKLLLSNIKVMELWMDALVNENQTETRDETKGIIHKRETMEPRVVSCERVNSQFKQVCYMLRTLLSMTQEIVKRTKVARKELITK